PSTCRPRGRRICGRFCTRSRRITTSTMRHARPRCSGCSKKTRCTSRRTPCRRRRPTSSAPTASSTASSPGSGSNGIRSPSSARLAGRLVLHLSAGPWIRLYSFDREVVLNAQLQAVLSLEDYAQLEDDAPAQALATALNASAQALLPRFDTGAWSLYSLGGPEAPLA